MEVGDKVMVDKGEVIIVGKVKAIDEFRVIVVEEYAASIWGTSDGCAGKVWSEDHKDVKAYEEDDNEEETPIQVHCYMCLPIERRMEDKGPLRKVVSTKVVNAADPTEAYTLECGHTII